MVLDQATINTIITYIITIVAAIILAVRAIERKWNRKDACMLLRDAIEVLRETDPAKASELELILRPFCEKYWSGGAGVGSKAKSGSKKG